jgi:2-keto-4-pentenoate hydratase
MNLDGADTSSDDADDTPADKTAAAVARGMLTLLARRDAALATGAEPVGWKIGFNTPAIQEHFGLTQAVVGYLTDAGVSPPGATIALAGWGVPAVEVEVALRVGDDGRVAGLAPALELVDLDTSFDDIEPVLAGNICHRGVIFGEEVPGVNPWAMVARVTRAGQVVAEGCLVEDPAITVAFVRSYLAAHGASLQAGDKIIAGSVVAPISVAEGDELSVSFGPLGNLSVRFRI